MKERKERNRKNRERDRKGENKGIQEHRQMRWN